MYFYSRRLQKCGLAASFVQDVAGPGGCVRAYPEGGWGVGAAMARRGAGKQLAWLAFAHRSPPPSGSGNSARLDSKLGGIKRGDSGSGG